jgi:hypothetical protein
VDSKAPEICDGQDAFGLLSKVLSARSDPYGKDDTFAITLDVKLITSEARFLGNTARLGARVDAFPIPHFASIVATCSGVPWAIAGFARVPIPDSSFRRYLLMPPIGPVAFFFGSN